MEPTSLSFGGRFWKSFMFFVLVMRYGSCFTCNRSCFTCNIPSFSIHWKTSCLIQLFASMCQQSFFTTIFPLAETPQVYTPSRFHSFNILSHTSTIFLEAFGQWPFQEPRLEVPTIYKAYVKPMWGDISRKDGLIGATSVYVRALVYHQSNTSWQWLSMFHHQSPLLAILCWTIQLWYHQSMLSYVYPWYQGIEHSYISCITINDR